MKFLSRNLQGFWFDKSRLIISLSILCFFSLPLAAQSTGSLTGQVFDPSGALVPSAIISLSTSTQKLTTKSSNTGRYEFNNLAPGIYQLIVDAPGFAHYLMEDVTISAQQSRELNITLSIADQQQQINVTGEDNRVGVSADQNASATVLKGRDLDALSDNPDELQTELGALAGPAAGPNGSDMYIDGFSGGQLPPKSTIREIRINQNPFSAEFDRIGYGRIEILTKPGAQKLNGTLGASYVNSIFDTAVPLSATQPHYHFYWVSGDISGPITKRASFFYDIFNFVRQNQSTIHAVNPANTATTLAETFPNPSNYLYTTGRIDLQATKSQTLSIRGFIFVNTVHGVGVGGLDLSAQAINYTNPAHSVQVTDSIILTPHIADEINFQWKRDREINNPTSPLPTINVEGAFVDGGSGTNNENYLTAFELQNYITANEGRHVMRFGARLRSYNDKVRNNSGTNGSYTFQTTQQYVAGTPYLYSITKVNQPITKLLMFDAALFFQDEWHLRPNLSLSSGLRVEGQNRIHDRADLAPRLAVAWSPQQKPGTAAKTVLRVGSGFFYNRFTVPNFSGGGGGIAYLIQTIQNNGINQQNYVVSQNPGAFYNPNPTTPYIPSAPGSSTPYIYTLDPHFHAALNMQTGIGLDRQLAKQFTLSMNYLYTRGIHQYLTNNVNAPTFDPATYTLTTPAPSTYNYQLQSGGTYKQRQLIVTSNANLKKLSMHATYVYNHADSDTQSVSYFPSVADDPSLDYGRASFGVTHQFTLYSTYVAPLHISISPILFAQSGTPYNITLGNDLTGNNQSNARPTFGTCGATGVVTTMYGCLDTNPVGKGERIIPYNLGTGPANAVVHLRITRSFGIGPRAAVSPTAAGAATKTPALQPRKYSLSVVAGAANLFNVVNYAPPNGTLSSLLFGQSQSLAGGPYGLSSPGNRTVYFTLNLSF
jgi:hypothetical protein